MLKIENLSYAFPQKELYNEISFTLEEGQHCAFIGISGSGKSTLIDLILDPENYMYEGTLELAPNCRTGYVSQFPSLEKTEGVTVLEYIGGECIRLQKEIDRLCAEMGTTSDIESVLEKYQEALDAFEALGGNDFESNISKKLNLANLMNHKDSMVSDLSGGEFKLVQVIKEMLNNPDLLIMDEPDVFLDFENLNALKNLINTHKGTLLVITHNRYLLNHCFNKIIHLENMELQEFDGTYIDYNFSLLQGKIELQEIAADEAEEIKRNQILVDKLRKAATDHDVAAKGKKLKARVKMQERLEARRVKAPFVAIKQPNIRLNTYNEIEETVALKVTDLTLAFDEVLLENINFEINSNEKVAIIGSNGTGKTTLLKEIFKNSNPSIEVNENIEMAYLSQVQGEMLNEGNTIMEEFHDTALRNSDEIKVHLSRYGFEEDLLNQKIGSLSGGEKNILQLAKVATTKANLLLLDEPTSHLDTYSQLALEKALENYNGAILMISHDFYSIVNCMDYVLIIEDKSIRKMKMKKFKRMIYAEHFDKDYLEIEQKKKAMETKIAQALENNDFEGAKVLCEELEP
ncbi:MAG: ABC-F family ATP-binding cassette domain-containing protein, partial [Clostridium sp.]